MREIHLLNGPGIIDTFLRMVRPFLKKELLEAVSAIMFQNSIPIIGNSNDHDVYLIELHIFQIHTHSSAQSLCDHFGKEHIPVDVGGTLSQTRDELTSKLK